jgi:hypothetical protein
MAKEIVALLKFQEKLTALVVHMGRLVVAVLLDTHVVPDLVEEDMELHTNAIVAFLAFIQQVVVEV